MPPKPKPGERVGPVEAPFEDGGFEKEFPNLHDYLTSQKYGDGTPRVTSTILLFCENGVLRLCVNDRDNNRSVFFTSDTFAGVLLKAEDALATQTAEWRARQGYARQNERTPF